jgi:RNA 3'-terminal phosphate cyclase-like protein
MAAVRLIGGSHFRQRIICSTLSGRTVRIDDIRVDTDAPGVTDYEANFLRLIDKMTNGSKIEINETGTTLKYVPGFILGGKVQHDCGNSRYSFLFNL